MRAKAVSPNKIDAPLKWQNIVKISIIIPKYVGNIGGEMEYRHITNWKRQSKSRPQKWPEWDEMKVWEAGRFGDSMKNLANRWMDLAISSASQKCHEMSSKCMQGRINTSLNESVMPDLRRQVVLQAEIWGCI